MTSCFMQGKIDLADGTNGNEMRLELEGVHFLATGSIYAFAESVG